MKEDAKADDRDRIGMDVRHLRRDARTALEMAIVSLAPSSLIDGLAIAAGLLEALTDLPADSPPIIPTTTRAVSNARAALQEWKAWQSRHLEGRIPKV
jgi:hypothetical protein